MIINLPNHVLANQSHAAHNQADGVLQHYRLMPLLWLRAMGETAREIAVPRSSCFVWGPRRRCRRGSSCWRPGASATPASTSGPSRASPWGTPSVTSASCCCWACGDRIPGWPFGPSPAQLGLPLVAGALAQAGRGPPERRATGGNGSFVELLVRRAAPSLGHLGRRVRLDHLAGPLGLSRAERSAVAAGGAGSG